MRLLVFELMICVECIEGLVVMLGFFCFIVIFICYDVLDKVFGGRYG